MLVPYEYYWGTVKYFPKSYDVESLGLWADWRGEIDDLEKDDVVIMGSSRGHFDINIHLWDSITGRRPIMLAYPGSSPFHPIEDLVRNSDFRGLLIISTAPGLFYTVADSWGAGRGKAFVDHYHKSTYAQRFNHFIFKQLDAKFAFLDPSINYRSLIDHLPFENRDSVSDPEIWPPMVTMDRYRNIRMIPQMETDTVLQKQQTDIWDMPVWKNRYVDSVDVIMSHYVGLVKEFKEKGGRVAFIRPPVTGKYLENEPVMFPRDKYWDRLLEESGSPGYHFQDNEMTSKMNPPEWSHLNRKEADLYTKIIIDLLKQDGLINSE